jgi:hypothetical protein
MVARVPATPPTTANPPDLPNAPQLGPLMTDYLRRFSLWAKKGLDGKQPIGQAQTGILLMANDAPAGTAPAVFLLQVNTAGTIVLTPVPLGESS